MASKDRVARLLSSAFSFEYANFDRVEIGRVWQQKEEPGAASPAEVFGSRALVEGDVVEDDDIARRLALARWRAATGWTFQPTWKMILLPCTTLQCSDLDEKPERRSGSTDLRVQ